MGPGARTPEELETMLEDAFVVRDVSAVALLFEAAAVLLTGTPPREARGTDAIARAAAELWRTDSTYLASPERVVQAGSTALVLTGRGLSVARRDADGAWRYAIALLATHDNRQEAA